MRKKKTSFDVVPNGFYWAYKNSLEVNHKKRLKIEPAESSSLFTDWKCSLAQVFMANMSRHFTEKI
jgi:hypothetical protein